LAFFVENCCEIIGRVLSRTTLTHYFIERYYYNNSNSHHHYKHHHHLITMTSAKVLNTIAIILDLIERQDWQTFQSGALSSAAFFRALTAAIANCPEFNGMTLLHAVVRYNPPLDMVAKMMKICPDLPAAKDCLGRTPLHVAAGSAAEPRLIKLIAHAHPASCDATDEDGKTPLHFACDSSCELFEDDDATNQSMPRKVCHDTVRALLSESLLAATMEDMDETNPLEYAILSDAELKTVKLLQKASCKTLQSTSRSSSPSPVPENKRPRRVVSDPDTCSM
jgi:ankyrin repeat protein